MMSDGTGEVPFEKLTEGTGRQKRVGGLSWQNQFNSSDTFPFEYQGQTLVRWRCGANQGRYTPQSIYMSPPLSSSFVIRTRCQNMTSIDELPAGERKRQREALRRRMAQPGHFFKINWYDWIWDYPFILSLYHSPMKCRLEAWIAAEVWKRSHAVPEIRATQKFYDWSIDVFGLCRNWIRGTV